MVSYLNENQQLDETTLQFHLDNLKSINKNFLDWQLSIKTIYDSDERITIQAKFKKE